MKNKTTVSVVVLLSIIFLANNTARATDPNLAIIVNHTCTNITAVPQSAIEQAKTSLHIAYGHTSHGSQLITGMNGLIAFANGGGKGLSLPPNIFQWNNGGTSGALDLRDTPFSSTASDLGNPDFVAWEAATRTYLNAHPEVNVIIWSWCGQVSTATQANINTYLSLMSGLEEDYPSVMFVYMTGHLDGGGQAGNLNIRNQQIRDYCAANNKILYDFADIESYDPNGLVNYMELLANDNCDYDSDNNGSRDKNWATDWQGTHTVNVDWYDCSPAHSQALNGNQKAYAAWWLWAWLGGWRGNSCMPAPSNLVADANSSTQQITLTWTDNSHEPNNEDSFIIQRQVDSGSWNNNYDTVSADVTTFVDSSLAYGTYRYRVVAHSSGSCDSSPSSVAVAVLTSQIPNAPTSLNSAVNDSVINLTWTDNSSNEENFILERKIDSNSFTVLDDAIPAGTTNYQDSDIEFYHTYTYRIKAHNDFGDSNYSNETSQYIEPNLPNAPSSLNSTVNGSAINLTWTDNSNNEETFILERKIDSGGFAVLAGGIPAGTVNYSDTNLAPLHTYTYRIKAHNSFGDSGYSNETSRYIYASTTKIKLQSTTEVDDSFLESAEPNNPHGAEQWSTVTDRYIVKFIFPPEVLYKKILDANIAFYGWNQTNYHAGEYMDLYRVTRNWQESTVTWNIAQTGQSWNTAGGDYAELLGQVPLLLGGNHVFYPGVHITDIVQKWVNGTANNYGLLLINNALTDIGLKASEYSNNARTYLEITYTTGCSCVLAGDINYDCVVDFYDFAKLAQNWLMQNSTGDIAPAPAGDGIVDINDVGALSDDWLTECP